MLALLQVHTTASNKAWAIAVFLNRKLEIPISQDRFCKLIRFGGFDADQLEGRGARLKDRNGGPRGEAAGGDGKGTRGGLTFTAVRGFWIGFGGGK